MVAMPSGAELLAVWEAGETEHGIERALTMLEAFTGCERRELAALGIHRRDALLVESRICAFGTTVSAVAPCAACRALVELELPLHVPAEAMLLDEGAVDVDGTPIRFRVPDSRDLAAAAACPDVESAAATLRARCIAASAGVGEAGLEAAEAALAALCAPAEIVVAARCPECDAPFAPVVDVGTILWRELCAYAGRLLDEVVALALRYGWSEAEILAISDRRRRYYLEAVE